MKLLLILVLLAICLASPVFSLRGNSYWRQHNKAENHHSVEFRVALNQRNIDILESTLLDVSNPKSENYGKHWDMESIIDLVAPDASISRKVVNYLKSQGCTHVENHRDFIKASASVSVIEKIFDVEMFKFNHVVKRGESIVRSSGQYSVPNEIVDYVQIVTGISELPHLKAPKGQKLQTNKRAIEKTLGAQSVDPGIVVPATIQTLYGIPTGYENHPNTSVCLAEFSSDRSYNPKDLQTFADKTGTPLIKVTKTVGPFAPTDPDDESTLDVQYAGSTAQTADVWFWTVSGWMYEFSSDLASTYPAPYVVSMSWGWPEPQQCQSGIGNCTNGETSEQYVDRVNVEFMKIGLRGITLLASSGDQGAPGDSNPSCSSKVMPLSTIFPGASPYVTSVGATMLAAPSADDNTDASDVPVCDIHKCATSTTEVTCTYPEALITTGGGFSVYSPRPSWQSDAVEAYLKSGATFPPTKYFNSSNRAFPDVSALGHNYYTVAGDQMTVVDGTSCSSPVMGGIVALLNSYRLNNGKSTLGFINPLLYAAYAENPAIYNDITVGNNYCTESCCAKYGFQATKGYDAATGLGSVSFKPMLQYVQSLK